MSNVLISGGTGYIGRRLAAALLTRGHNVRVLARRESVTRVPAGATAVVGNALSAADVAAALTPDTTLVHLVGTPHPSPSKAAEFKAVDLPAALASVAAAAEQRVAHLVYVSVAHPAPVMEAYIASRVAAEAAITDAGLTATVLRPWYVLGPGHRWPIALAPIYALLEGLVLGGLSAIFDLRYPGIAMQAVLLSLYLALRQRAVLFAIMRAWKRSLFAGFAGAVASQFWFLAFALSSAANVRTLALIEVLFAQMIARFAFGQRTSAREALGMVLVVAGVALLIWAQ